jgi:hypothetical protein
VICYQLVAKGFDFLNERRTYHSRKIYLSRSAAEAATAGFINKCCNSDPESINSLADLDPTTISVIITELELMDD